MINPQARIVSEVSSSAVWPSANSLLVARNLRRLFQQGGQMVIAVAEASCAIRPGDRIAITGPSGSGKSTLLHLFAGLDQPTSGTIHWPALGEPNDLRPAQIGLALQAPGLLPPLNVIENVTLPLLIQATEPAQARAMAGQILDRLELAHLAEQLPEELSGGQAQRVALARALVTRPPLILLDEPTGQLDHPTAQRLFDLLFSAIADRQTAVVVTTHDPAVAERFAQVWHMHQGVLEGAPANG